MFQNVKLGKHWTERKGQTGEEKSGLHWRWGWGDAERPGLMEQKFNTRAEDSSLLSTRFQAQTSLPQADLCLSAAPERNENIPRPQAAEDPDRSPEGGPGAYVHLLRSRR